MCHKFDLRDRLEINPLTLPVTDILATKLQVFQANEKDYRDIVTILVDYDVDTGIDGVRIAKLCADDWGIYMTFNRTLRDTLSKVDLFELDTPARDTVKSRIKKLNSMIESMPKSTKWQLRAIVGEKAQWYKLPDDTVGI